MPTVIQWEHEVERSALIEAPSLPPTRLALDDSMTWHPSEYEAQATLRDAIVAEAAVLMARVERMTDRIVRLDAAIAGTPA